MAGMPVDLARKQRASKVAKDLGFTSGHMRRLIRDKIIDAELIRGHWYISNEALGTYLAGHKEGQAS